MQKPQKKKKETKKKTKKNNRCNIKNVKTKKKKKVSKKTATKKLKTILKSIVPVSKIRSYSPEINKLLSSRESEEILLNKRKKKLIKISFCFFI